MDLWLKETDMKHWYCYVGTLAILIAGIAIGKFI